MRIPHGAAFLPLLLVAALVLVVPGCARGVHPPAGAAAAARGAVHGEATPPHVVLVSLDGFRPDYLERGVTPTLGTVARTGARVEALVPVFPTKTFTNHYTLVTGLHADRHGIVSNRFYDPELDAFYRVPGQGGVGEGHWYGGEPIWVLAERSGLRTGTMFWPGSEAAIGGVRPSNWHAFDPAFDEQARVDTVLAWLGRPAAERPRLATLYLNSVDDAGHAHGPDAAELNVAVARADALLARLLDGIARSPVADAVNVVIVSDHGMTEFRDWIHLDDFVDLEGVVAVMTEPSASLWFRGDSARMDAVYATLRAGLAHARVFRRHELPAAWRIRDNPRIGDLLVMPDEHYRVGLRSEGAAAVRGLHGYEPMPSMHGILLATGPAFAAGVRIGPVEAVHVYPLLAQLLGLPVAGDIDGRPDRLAPLLRRGATAGNVPPREWPE
jgi:predicted AlkP superfamily pyrophosphatase or phosphodiesterase